MKHQRGALAGAVLLLGLCFGSEIRDQALAQAPLGGPGKELIAVLDFNAVGASEIEASALTDRLNEELLKSGRFVLVGRSLIDKVLAEQALQQSGCTSQECAVQVGRMLGVRKLVSGRVTRINPQLWLLSGTLVDVQTAETERAESVRHRGNMDDLMEEPVSLLAARLAGTSGAGVPAAGSGQTGSAPAQPVEAPQHPAAAPAMTSERFAAWLTAVHTRKPKQQEFTPWMPGAKLTTYLRARRKTDLPVRVEITRQNRRFVHRVVTALQPKPPGGIRWEMRLSRDDAAFEQVHQSLREIGYVLLHRDRIGGDYQEVRNDGIWVKPR